MYRVFLMLPGSHWVEAALRQCPGVQGLAKTSAIRRGRLFSDSFQPGLVPQISRRDRRITNSRPFLKLYTRGIQVQLRQLGACVKI